MSDFISWYTFIAFVLGVLFSGMVKALVVKVRGKG